MPSPFHLALRYLQYPVFFIELSKGLYMSENVPLLPLALGEEIILGEGDKKIRNERKRKNVKEKEEDRERYEENLN